MSTPTKPVKSAIPTWVRPRDALAVYPGGMTRLYEDIKSGAVRSKKYGGMRLIDLASAANPGEPTS
jgi:hypothetical protein